MTDEKTRLSVDLQVLKYDWMWLYLLATAKFMRQYEIRWHSLMCQTTQILKVLFVVVHVGGCQMRVKCLSLAYLFV